MKLKNREEIVKDIRKIAEEAKVAIRSIRRDGIDEAKAKQFDQQKAKTITYSTPSLLLGLHTPSLLLGIGYSKSFKKGRRLSSPGDRQDYLSYEYDEEGKLIRITDHGDSLKYFYCIFAP